MNWKSGFGCSTENAMCVALQHRTQFIEGSLLCQQVDLSVNFYGWVKMTRAYRKRVRVFGEVEASRNESRLGDWRARFLEGSTRCTGVCVLESTESIFTALRMKGEG